MKLLLTTNRRLFWLLLFLLIMSSVVGSVLKSLLLLYLSLLTSILIFRSKLVLIKFPPRILYYIVFLVFLAISVFWSSNRTHSLILLSYFFSGLVVWIVGFNFLSEKVLYKLILYLGILLGILALFCIVFLNSIHNPLSLVLYSVEPRHHHHVGDYWILIMVSLGFNQLRLNYKIKICIFILGFLILLLSLSRSAYLALLITSILTYLNRFKLSRNQKRLFLIYIFSSIFLFFYASFQKSTLLAHYTYYGVGFLSAIKNPFGIGIGNFDIVSERFSESYFGIKVISGVAHNLLLEIATGLGIFALSYIYWLFLVFRDISSNMTEKTLLISLMFVALFINFMTDYTYLLPAMFWLWMLILGVIQREKKFRSL